MTNDNILLVLDQHAYLDFNSVGKPKLQSAGGYKNVCSSIPTHYSDFEPTSHCSYSLEMKQQLNTNF